MESVFESRVKSKWCYGSRIKKGGCRDRRWLHSYWKRVESSTRPNGASWRRPLVNCRRNWRRPTPTSGSASTGWATAARRWPPPRRCWPTPTPVSTSFSTKSWRYGAGSARSAPEPTRSRASATRWAVSFNRNPIFKKSPYPYVRTM